LRNTMGRWSTRQSQTTYTNLKLLFWRMNPITFLLNNAKEFDHEGFYDLNWDWEIYKIHKFERASRSRLHKVEIDVPPILVSPNYEYYILKPIMRLMAMHLYLPDRVYPNVCGYPIPRGVVLGLKEWLKCGVITFHVRRGICDAIFVRYLTTWDEEVVEEIIARKISEGIEP